MTKATSAYLNKPLRSLKDVGDKPMTHTPGPWKSDREIWWVNTPGEQEQHGGLIIYPADNEDLTIASVNDFFNREIGAANARLIVEAPNLLEALETLLVGYIRGCHDMGDSSDDIGRNRNIREARAAIAKATKGE